LEPGGLAEAAISGGLSRTIESAGGQQLPTEFGGVHTAFRSRRRRFIRKGCLLEWSPFEILLVSPTCYSPLMTLLT
jgi:hypothetical protein